MLKQSFKVTPLSKAPSIIIRGISNTCEIVKSGSITRKGKLVPLLKPIPIPGLKPIEVSYFKPTLSCMFEVTLLS